MPCTRCTRCAHGDRPSPGRQGRVRGQVDRGTPNSPQGKSVARGAQRRTLGRGGTRMHMMDAVAQATNPTTDGPGKEAVGRLGWSPCYSRDSRCCATGRGAEECAGRSSWVKYVPWTAGCGSSSTIVATRSGPSCRPVTVLDVTWLPTVLNCSPRLQPFLTLFRVWVVGLLQLRAYFKNLGLHALCWRMLP